MVRGLNITVDYYNIKIKDRITLTENLQGQDIRDALTKAGLAGSSARFFINGIDTRTQGLDVVASYRLPDMGIGKLTLPAGNNLNDPKITERRTSHDLTADRQFSRPDSLHLTARQPSNQLHPDPDCDYGPAGQP